ncbi:MAG: ABC transporter permease [Tepidanaerobacteraceae bacterium]|nr:ABC transporter permease [Tepidanaerobacteraceae bacterium]
MWQYIVRRLAIGIIILFGISFITFSVTMVLPADPAARWVGSRATAEQIAQARVELGLDKPLLTRYAIYITNLLHGNWGLSIRTHQPVLKELMTYLPPTLELIIAGMLFALALGLPLGIAAATRRDGWLDQLCRTVSVAGVSFPTFWLGMILQLIFFRYLHILPLGDRLDTMLDMLSPIKHYTGFLLLDSLFSGNIAVFINALSHIILPAMTLAAYPIGLVARQSRASLLEVLNEDYVKAARAYGIKERTVLYTYALRNAMGPTITVLALSAGYSLTNTFLIEALFNWPGLGNYTSSAIITMDYTAITGITILVAIAYLILNLAVDLILALDPRVRY